MTKNTIIRVYIYNTMNLEDEFNKLKEERNIEFGFEPLHSSVLLVDILLFNSIIKVCFETVDKKIKKAQIERLLTAANWVEHFKR